MKNISKVADTVESVLRHIPETRNSDNALYVWVCMSYNREVVNKPFGDVLRHQKDYGIPKFETVRRARQKVQATQPELAADEKVTDRRFENYKAVRAFANG